MHKHKVFISYHHDNDQRYKDKLIRMGEEHAAFIDKSVGEGDISEDLTDQQIRRKIRDDYLKDSTVTIVLVGTETKRRKHVDWEIYSSMHDGWINKKSGILVINLPSTASPWPCASHEGEIAEIYPDTDGWREINSRIFFEEYLPYVPDRIIDNLVEGALISVVPWKYINPSSLKYLIDVTFRDRAKCKYDLSRRMRPANS